MYSRKQPPPSRRRLFCYGLSGEEKHFLFRRYEYDSIIFFPVVGFAYLMGKAVVYK